MKLAIRHEAARRDLNLWEGFCWGIALEVPKIRDDFDLKGSYPGPGLRLLSFSDEIAQNIASCQERC